MIYIEQRETRPVYAALAVSLVLHALLAWFNPSLWAHLREPEMDTIVIELLREDVGKPTPTPRSDTLPQAKAKEQTQATKTTPPIPAEPTAPATPTSGLQGEAQANPLQLKVETKPLEPETALELTSANPDPISDLVREATISLNDPDRRYRGFLGRIRAAIDLKWRAREAMLKAQRSGLATVRFTLSSGGGGANAPSLIVQSGSSILDSEALRAVQAANFPAFPDNWAIRRLNLIGDFEYAISGM